MTGPLVRPPLNGDVHQTWPGKRWWQKPGPWCRTKARLRLAASCGPALATVPASPAARLTTWWIAVYAIVQGCGIMVGGMTRWTSPSFAVLSQVPYPTLTWGLALIAAGVLVLFASGAADAVSRIPTQVTTGAPTYAFIAGLAVILLAINERVLAVTRVA